MIPAASGESPLVRVEQVSHTFRTPDGSVGALDDITLALAPGEFCAIVGPSGSGKTTLLRIVGGLIRPETGRVLFDGVPLRQPPPDVGFAFQQPTLLPWRTVIQNVVLPLEVQGVAPAEATARARNMLEVVGLEEFADATPETLSGGMQQRAALARALVGEPRLLLLDEPFGALDAILRTELNLELLGLWHAYQPTVMFVTHDIGEAVFLADRVLALSRRPGRVIARVNIDLPRPRTAEMRYSPQAQAYLRDLWEALSGSS